MDLFLILIILIGLFMFAMISMVIGFAIFAGIGWLVLVLIQLGLGTLIQKVTGRHPEWLMSKKTFTIEAVIALAAVFVYFALPFSSGKLIPDTCASISYSTIDDDGGSRSICRPEIIEDTLNLLDQYELRRRLNLPFLNESVIWHDNGGLFLYLRDEDGTLLKKIRFYGDMFGVSDREDGEFAYYKAAGKLNTYPYMALIHQEGWANTMDAYQDPLNALYESWIYESGTLSCTIPDWGTDDWSLSVDARVPVLDENGEKTDTDYITYLKEGSETGDWAFQTVSFTLMEAPHEELTCTVRIDGFSYECSLLDMADEAYVWPEE